MAHALLMCGGGAPAYFTPGFAPLSLAWGWLLLGALLGATATRLVVWTARSSFPFASRTRAAALRRQVPARTRERSRGAAAMRGVPPPPLSPVSGGGGRAIRVFLPISHWSKRTLGGGGSVLGRNLSSCLVSSYFSAVYFVYCEVFMFLGDTEN